MRRLTTVTVTVMCLAGLAGCTGASGDPTPSITPATTTTPTPTPTPTPVAAGPRDLSNADLGIVFTDFPHDQDEVTAAAIESFMLFETEFWRALTTNVVPPGPWAEASADSIAWIQAQVDPNSASGVHADGTWKVSIGVVSVDPATVVLDTCVDLGEVVFVGADGSTENAVDPGGVTTDGVRLTLIPGPGDSWKVDTHEFTGSC